MCRGLDFSASKTVRRAEDGAFGLEDDDDDNERSDVASDERVELEPSKDA